MSKVHLVCVPGTPPLLYLGQYVIFFLMLFIEIKNVSFFAKKRYYTFNSTYYRVKSIR